MTKKKTKIKVEEVEDKWSFWRLAQWDWVTFSGATRLHALKTLADAEQADIDWSGSGLTVCGRWAWVSIPGIFSRMGVERCRHCCRVLGYPQGVGSPKNDDACQPFLDVINDNALTLAKVLDVNQR